ncbi:hypothetical protein [Rhodoplanes sp. SY1]|uniref:hypothetical protein n=1 Tax=Rhodoplanes sp. SY1 TaxID=3166646 RepID=UPI0038B5ED5A
MNERVAKLEAIAEGLQKAVERIQSDSGSIREGLARIEAKIDTRAAATDVAAISAKLDDKPGTWRVVVIAMVIGGLVTAASVAGVKLLPQPQASVAAGTR